MTLLYEYGFGVMDEQPRSSVDPLSYDVPSIPKLPKWKPGLEHKPLVILDVDGVINRIVPLTDPPPEVERHDVVIPAWAIRESRWIYGRGCENLPTPVLIDPAMGPWINSLIERGCDVVWCTTWEFAAPIVLGPLLGIPPLPVVQLHHPLVRIKQTSLDSKGGMITGLFQGRPVAWLDDHSSYFHGGGKSPSVTRPPNQIFIPGIKSRLGITPKIRAKVDAWVERRHPPIRVKDEARLRKATRRAHKLQNIPDLARYKAEQARFQEAANVSGGLENVVPAGPTFPEIARGFHRDPVIGAWLDDIRLELIVTENVYRLIGYLPVADTKSGYATHQWQELHSGRSDELIIDPNQPIVGFDNIDAAKTMAIMWERSKHFRKS